eukprot:GFUD01046736.1.p1 GENE.GFUD01046736.1~~GFUD01046736.1.p1  ORF type:complete len:175 (+),score=22.43 GFUD01046736.1:68-526(+)
MDTRPAGGGVNPGPAIWNGAVRDYLHLGPGINSDMSDLGWSGSRTRVLLRDRAKENHREGWDNLEPVGEGEQSEVVEPKSTVQLSAWEPGVRVLTSVTTEKLGTRRSPIAARPSTSSTAESRTGGSPTTVGDTPRLTLAGGGKLKYIQKHGI